MTMNDAQQMTCFFPSNPWILDPSNPAPKPLKPFYAGKIGYLEAWMLLSVISRQLPSTPIITIVPPSNP